MVALAELEPFGLEEYDTPELTVPQPEAEVLNDSNHESAAALTQMEENLGVEDLGVEDILQTKVRRPLPKLDAGRLLNPRRGYPFLLEHLKKVEYRGKGDEKRFLKKYVNTYLIWANRLWPKANFDDFTILARKAGRDPRVRQYCRNLIEEEKYGSKHTNGSDAYEPIQASLTEPSSVIQSMEHRQPHDSANPSVFPRAERHERDEEEDAMPENDQFAASPPPWMEDAAGTSEGAGPNEDEEAAALELYGDLDM